LLLRLVSQPRLGLSWQADSVAAGTGLDTRLWLSGRGGTGTPPPAAPCPNTCRGPSRSVIAHTAIPSPSRSATSQDGARRLRRLSSGRRQAPPAPPPTGTSGGLV